MTRVERRDPGQDLQPQDADRARAADAELLLDGVLQAARRSAGPGGQRRPAEVLRGRQRAARGDARSRTGRPTCAGTSSTRRRPASPRRSSTRTSTSTARPCRARPRTRSRWKRCVGATDGAIGVALGKAYVRDYFPPEAKARADAMVKNLIAALRDGSHDAALDGRGHAQGRRSPSSTTFDPKIGYPDEVARLLGADRSTAGRYVAERPARERVRVPARPREDRQARRPRRTGSMTPPDRQRVLQPAEERDRLPGRHPAAALLRREGGRRRQLRRDGRGDRPRDDARLRRPGPQVRRAGQPARLVDARGRSRTTTSAPSASRSSSTAYVVRRPARQRQARPRRGDRGPRRPHDRVPRVPGARSPASPSRRRSTASRPTSASSWRGPASGRPTSGPSSPSS